MNGMKHIPGGVTAPLGFTASGVCAGVKAGNKTKKDLMLILSEREAAAAAVYTLNRVKAAPIYVTMEHLEDGVARAMICNSGNANACAPNSHEHAETVCAQVAKALSIDADEIIVGSTGVIGQELNVAAIVKAIPSLVEALSPDGSDAAALAIMTTDTVKKEISVEITLDGKPVCIGGVAKGSGMIHPNMGTMLAFITTDCAITHDMLQSALSESVKVTYNRVSVDGDTSTNDMCAVMANSMAGNQLIEWRDDNYKVFAVALNYVNQYLAKAIAADGEGATKLITCRAHHARTEESAERLAMGVIRSSLVKAAMFGSDANWGRVLCAMGYSKAPFRPEFVDITFLSAAGDVMVCKQGAGLTFDEELAKSVLLQNEITIDINLNEGDSEATAWGCDLTYDYVKINGDYRT